MESVNKSELVKLLRAFVNQRPGIESVNYGGGIEGYRAYRQEVRRVQRQRRDALLLLDQVLMDPDVTAQDLTDAMQSGRLTWDGERQRVEYCAGQYFAVEYRPAVASVCGNALRAAEVRRVKPANGGGDGWKVVRQNLTKRLGRRLASSFM